MSLRPKAAASCSSSGLLRVLGRLLLLSLLLTLLLPSTVGQRKRNLGEDKGRGFAPLQLCWGALLGLESGASLLTPDGGGPCGGHVTEPGDPLGTMLKGYRSY